MQYQLAKKIKETPTGKVAEAILSKCVHCGMCTATCPTYQLLGDELDGPRGRIYQIKQVLEGEPATAITQKHLDRCLGCLACETTCPAGVEYGKLAEIGKNLVEAQVKRTLIDRLKRKLFRQILPHPVRFGFFFKLGVFFKFVLPTRFKNQLHATEKKTYRLEQNHNRKMLLLNGCVQSVIKPNINAAAISVFDKLGISLIMEAKNVCCGAISLHLQASDEAKDFMRTNIDAWWQYVEEGVEAIVITASGCGTVVKHYGDYLADDPGYALKAKKVSSMTKDISEVLTEEDLSDLKTDKNIKVAIHTPCSLQHGQQLDNTIQTILKKTGYVLVPVKDAHLCCGSAGVYSMLQTEIAEELRNNKLQALQQEQPDMIATANIGCLNHLQSGTNNTVFHWIELLGKA